MNLLDLVRRDPDPQPWLMGEKIPWNEPGFSKRMLIEHLSQEHDAASRRFEVIDQHVDWIHRYVLREQAVRVLDLGCGPGLYASRLAKLGHQCHGIDFSPASIAYAQEQAQVQGLEISYQLGDIRHVDYGGTYDLVMLVFGEFNVFRPSEAQAILHKAWQALEHGGVLLLEPHTFSAVEKLGKAPASWYTTESGLFSEHPHLCLEESFWDEAQQAATTRFFIVDAQSGDITRHAMSTQAYRDEVYMQLLQKTGFVQPAFFPGLGTNPEIHQPELFAIVARKAPA